MSDELDRVARALEEGGGPDDPTKATPHEPEVHLENRRGNSFARMRRNWVGQDLITLGKIEVEIDTILHAEFPGIYAVLDEIHSRVREPRVGADDKIKRYGDGTPMWVCDSRGLPVEDWSMLDDTTRSNLLHVIYVHSVEWKAIAINLWARAMYSKTQWKEAFAS